MLIDSYENFIKYFKLENTFADWAIENTIFFTPEHEENFNHQWDKIKTALNGNDVEHKIYIRSNGNNGCNNDVLINVYKKVFPNTNIRIDAHRNTTTHSKVDQLGNYKRNHGNIEKFNVVKNFIVSHIFANTANPYLFHAPWNFCLTPAIVDPLTGHESNGNLTEEYKRKFFKKAFEKYNKYIEEYNAILKDNNYKEKISKAFDEYEKEISGLADNFKQQILQQWDPIIKENYI